MSSVTCKVEIPENTQLNVGSKFALLCEGEWPALKEKQLELRLDQNDQYKLRLLQFQKEGAGAARLLVTSYRPGAHQLKAVQLVDSEQSVVLSDLSFSVQSVINPQEPETEPFGPMGAIKFGLPIWYFVMLALVLIVAGSFAWFRIHRKLRRKKLLSTMHLEESPMSAMAQLSQKIRLIIRELNNMSDEQMVKDLDLAFRHYFARRFAIPTLVWKDVEILKVFRAENSELYKVMGHEVKKIFAELERARSSAGKLQYRDLEQLLQIVRHGSESIEKYGVEINQNKSSSQRLRLP